MKATNYKAVLAFLETVAKGVIDTKAEEASLKDSIHRGLMKFKRKAFLKHVRNEKVEVKNGYAELPCFLVRLLNVHDGNKRIGFIRVNGNERIKLPFITGHVFIDYNAMPFSEVDGEQLPVILSEQVEYLGWCAYEEYLFPLFMKGDIPYARMQVIEDKKRKAYATAQKSTSLLSINEVEAMIYTQKMSMFAKI